MKYRDHSLRYIPREKTPKPTRATSEPKPSTKEPEVLHQDNHFKSVRHDEPLFDVHDKTTRLDNFKETVGGIHHVTKDILVPFAKRHSKRLYKKTQPVVSAGSKTTLANIKKSSRRIPLSRTQIIQVIAVIIIFIGGYAVAHRTLPSDNNTKANPSITKEPVGGTEPTFDTLLPEGKSVEDFGGWSRVSPPDVNPVFAYTDTLERVPISISQQPMPESFSNNPDEDVKELALASNAKERVVADDATVYFIGTSTKGPQSVFLTKKGLLIFIKSATSIKNEAWSRYIAELQ